MSYTRKLFALLQRVTSSGEKLLYIDGLRFFAVMSVFIFHFIDYYDDNHEEFADKFETINNHLQGSVMGVILFFSISGFLIAMPFYRSYVIGSQKFSLRNYYFRRLTRLEPPYIVHLLLLFFLMVFVLKTKTFADIFPHLLASVFYCHEIIYHEMPILNTVLWTLEVEIQFYVLAPILALVFKLDPYARRTILITMVGLFIFYDPIYFDFPTVFKYIHYFLIGFLALDIYVEVKNRLGKHVFFDVICFVSLLFLWFSTIEYLTILLLFILLVYSSKTFFFVKILENKAVYTIGGMCYSIYMLHQKVIYFVSGLLLPDVLLGNDYLLDFFVRLVCMMCITLLISSTFFILIERPTMQKHWWRFNPLKKLFPSKEYIVNTKEISNINN